MTAPAIAGTHTITATCDGGKCSAPATGTITVIPEPLTLELDPALKGDPALSIEPGQSHATYVRVTSTRTKEPKSGVEVRVRVDVTANSGGHDHHDNARPQGTLTGSACAPPEVGCITATTGADGKAGFNFNAPIVSGTHTFSAACVKPTCTNEDSGGQIEVKVAGLVEISSGSSTFKLIVKSPSNHSANNFLMPQALQNLRDFAFYYYVGLSAPRYSPLYLNDASLEWGGLFDVNGTWQSGFHAGHRRGAVIDIRANTAVGAIPETLFNGFTAIAKEVGAKAELHCTAGIDPAVNNCAGDSNRHYHVLLLGAGKDQ